MRVLFVSEPLFPIGGTSSRTLNLAKALTSKGHEVYIITPRESFYSYKKIKGIYIKRLKAFMPQSFGIERRINFVKFLTRGGLLQILSEIKKLYDPNKPTIVHYVNYYMSLCGLILEKFVRIRSIYDLQASAVLESKNDFNKVFMTLVERICCTAENIIVVSEEFCNYLINKYPSCQRKIEVIPLLVIHDFSVQHTKKNIRKKLDLQNNAKYLLVFHGSPYPENIKALRKVEKIVESLNAIGLDTKVLVLGFVSKYVSNPHFIPCGYVEDLSSHISAADLAVLPVDSRSLGMHTRILEYMSCEVPVLALLKGTYGYSEAKKQGAIILVQNVEELIRLSKNLLLDSSLRKQIISNANQYIQNYHSSSAIVNKLIHIYNKVLEN